MPKKVKSKTPLLGPKIQSSEIVPGGKLNNFLNNFPDKITNFKKSKTFYLVIIALGILILAVYKKSWFIAAMVNNTPITNLELQTKLNQQFKTQTLNQLINEKIILLEANKNGVFTTEGEIDQKITELEKNVGGKEVLDSLLSQQGQTRLSLRNQIKTQLTITKLYEKDATVSAEEVTKFIETNKQSLPSNDGKDLISASESAKLEKEASDAIKNQKLSQIFSQKFQELRQKAKIQIF